MAFNNLRNIGSCSGNPNGLFAGQVGDQLIDDMNVGFVYICFTGGDETTAVWFTIDQSEDQNIDNTLVVSQYQVNLTDILAGNFVVMPASYIRENFVIKNLAIYVRDNALNLGGTTGNFELRTSIGNNLICSIPTQLFIAANVMLDITAGDNAANQDNPVSPTLNPAYFNTMLNTQNTGDILLSISGGPPPTSTGGPIDISLRISQA